MKKALVLALAATAVVGQAHAGETGGDKDSKGLERAKTTREMDRAAKSSATAAGDADAARITRDIGKSNISMSSQSMRNLQVGITADAEIKKAANLALGEHAQGKNVKLNEVTIRGLAHLTGDAPTIVPEEQEAQQIVRDFYLSATAKAASWTDAKAKANVEYFGEALANHLDAGKPKVEAIKLAQAELKRDKGVDLNPKDISKLCK